MKDEDFSVGKERVLYLDMLRVIATAGVIMIHISAEMGPQTAWSFFVSYNCLGRFAVPVFFMISGSLFLNAEREYTFHKLYMGHIWKLARVFLFWSVVYTMRDVAGGLIHLSMPFSEVLKVLARSVVLGPTHFWFLPVMAALYMVVPVMRLISADKRITEYFLALWIIFSLSGRFVSQLTGISLIGEFLEKFDMHMVVGYSGYFLLGYYIHRWYRPIGMQKCLIYVSGVLSYIFTVAMTSSLSLEKQDYVETYLNGKTINCFFMALAVFVFVRSICEKGYIRGWLEKKTFRIAECSFGIYLLHMLSFNLVDYSGIAKKIVFSPVEIPFLVVLIFAGTYIIVRLIMRIPYIGRKLV